MQEEASRSKSKPRSKRRGRFALLATFGILSLATLALSDSANVQYLKDAGIVVDDPSVLGNGVVNLAKGAQVTVLGTQGDYTQVQSGTFTGWILTSDLSSQQPGADLLSGLGAGNNASASNATVAAAAHGLGSDAIAWSNAQNLDTSMVKYMESMRAFVTHDHATFEAFENSPEGRVGKQ